MALPVWMILILCLVYPTTASIYGLLRHYQRRSVCLRNRYCGAWVRKSLVVSCAILAIATVAAWIDSYVSNTSSMGGARLLIQGFGWQEHGGGYLQTSEGILELALFVPIDPARDDQGDEWTQHEFAGVTLDLQPTGDEEYIYLCVPLWMFLVLFAAYPTIAFIRGPLRRYRRRKKGLCLKCGYSLTGNTSGICPECGLAINGRTKETTAT